MMRKREKLELESRIVRLDSDSVSVVVSEDMPAHELLLLLLSLHQKPENVHVFVPRHHLMCAHIQLQEFHHTKRPVPDCASLPLRTTVTPIPCSVPICQAVDLLSVDSRCFHYFRVRILCPTFCLMTGSRVV